MLATSTETVYIPNALILNSTNILTTITNSVNSLLLSNNTWSGTNSFSNLPCTGYNVNTGYFGPILRSTVFYSSNDKGFTAQNFGINQMLVVYSKGAAFNMNLPDPKLCQGQVLYLYNSGTSVVTFTQNGTAPFLGKVSGNSFSMGGNNTYTLISSYSNWVVMSV